MSFLLLMTKFKKMYVTCILKKKYTLKWYLNLILLFLLILGLCLPKIFWPDGIFENKWSSMSSVIFYKNLNFLLFLCFLTFPKSKHPASVIPLRLTQQPFFLVSKDAISAMLGAHHSNSISGFIESHLGPKAERNKGVVVRDLFKLK